METFDNYLIIALIVGAVGLYVSCHYLVKLYKMLKLVPNSDNFDTWFRNGAGLLWTMFITGVALEIILIMRSFKQY